ncbi:hypothetical protein PMI42_03280 [Bradyrhizobium sp. YR681]|nr:hypothetical protein PMI42_03280 [Bradyrhizobium sp. YR681]
MSVASAISLTGHRPASFGRTSSIATTNFFLDVQAIVWLTNHQKRLCRIVLLTKVVAL